MNIHKDPASPNDDTSGDSSHVSECGDADESGLLYRKKK